MAKKPNELFSARMGYRQFPLQTSDLSERAKGRILHWIDEIWEIFVPDFGRDTFFTSRLGRDLFSNFAPDVLAIAGKPGLRTIAFHILQTRGDWHEYFSLLEHIGDWIVNEQPQTGPKVSVEINRLFEAENVGYRAAFREEEVDIVIYPVANEVEATSFAEAVNSPILGVREHLAKAAGLFETGDYNNVVRESISALEAHLISLTNGKAVTAGDALKLIGKQNAIHPALLTAMEKLYAFASDTVRHGDPNPPTLTLDDAKFAMVVVSALTNYLPQSLTSTQKT